MRWAVFFIQGSLAWGCKDGQLPCDQIQLISKSHENTLDAINITAFNNAAGSIRAAFAQTQAKIFLAKKHGGHDLREHFDAVFLSHATAIEEFRPFASNGGAYQEAWEDYRKTIYDDDVLANADIRWLTNMVIAEDGSQINNFLEDIEHKIGKVLNFCVQKR